MNVSDKPEFLRILTGLAAIKPGKPLTPEGLEVYWLALSDWDVVQFREAASHLAKSVEFMPNPYHFEQLRKAGQQTAGEAFGTARMICRSLSPREFRNHASGDPKLDKAIRACGGWEALAMCTSENIGFFERRFAEHYEAISDAEDIRDELPALTFGGESVFGSLGDMKRINAK